MRRIKEEAGRSNGNPLEFRGAREEGEPQNKLRLVFYVVKAGYGQE
jgi:hypothetical protein